MSVTSEVKAVARSKWFYLAVGIILGGTLLAYPVAKAIGFLKSKLPFFQSAADKSAAAAAGK